MKFNLIRKKQLTVKNYFKNHFNSKNHSAEFLRKYAILELILNTYLLSFVFKIIVLFFLCISFFFVKKQINEDLSFYYVQHLCSLSLFLFSVQLFSLMKFCESKSIYLLSTAASIGFVVVVFFFCLLFVYFVCVIKVNKRQLQTFWPRENIK